MAMRLQEIHPSLVHFPMALLPTAIAADALGYLTGSKTLLEMGRRLTPVAAVSALTAGVAGLLAQESSNITEEAHPYLITHRNLNLGLIALTGVMAGKRASRSRPSLRYLLAGAAGVATMTYSAYLGGHMVYELGVGVKAADGLLDGEAPQITRKTAREALDRSRDHVVHGVQHTVEQMGEGQIAPMLNPRRGNSRSAEAAHGVA